METDELWEVGPSWFRRRAWISFVGTLLEYLYGILLLLAVLLDALHRIEYGWS